MQINPITQLYNDFITILDKSVIKYRTEAEKYETVETKKAADGYMMAYMQEDKFETYYRFEREVIANVMTLTSERDIDFYYYDRDKIPIQYRDEMLRQQRQYVVNSYTELNNYYRCLNGLPNVEDTELDFVYPDDEIVAKYGLPTGVPIHEFDREGSTTDYIDILDSIGYIDELIAKYPEKKYLKFLGSNRIDIITARRAMNFSLLRVPYDISESLLNLFMLIYEQCREYFMTCIYITEYRTTIDYYDNFIAMCIMVMAFQQVVARTIKGIIERDFFDTYCCKLLFSVYNVPYYTEMDSATRTQLVQNLNLLVQNKGTNKVIYDIASILGYDRLEIFKYYIVKARKFDNKGLPVTVTKVDPDTGETVPDYKAMYDIYFQKVAISDDDAYDAVINSSDKQTYLEVTESDPYWIDDEALQKEMYESEYNFVESKYMGVGISYRMTKIIFENIYLMKMLLEKKDQIPNIIIDIPKMSTYATITLFDAIVSLCAMVCKQNRLTGEILTEPSKILHVLGFTFNDDWEVIKADITSTSAAEREIMGFNFSKKAEEFKEHIKNDKYLDDTLCDFFSDSSSYTAASINALYKNYTKLYEVLVEKMSTATDINVYQSYRKLYQAVFFTKENCSMFNIGTDSSGEPIYADTYMNYLKAMVPDMYDFINETEPDNMYSNVNYIVSRIMSILPDLKYLGFFDGHSNTMERMLIELIRFFKSYTTDLISMNIIYIFDLKPETMIRLIDYMEMHTSMIPRDFFNLSYADHLHFLSTVSYNSRLKLSDKMSSLHNMFTMFDTCRFMDSIKSIHNKEYTVDSLSYYDTIDHMLTTEDFDDFMKLRDLIASISNIMVTDNSEPLTFRDIIRESVNTMVKHHISIYDAIHITTLLYLKKCGRLDFSSNVKKILSTSMLTPQLSFKDQSMIGNTDINMNESTALMDIVDNMNKSIKSNIAIGFKDSVRISYTN